MKFGEKIRKQRIERGLTQAELGKKLGVGRMVISNWEHGQVSNISVSKIWAMANLFGVMPHCLIEEEK